MRFVAKLPESPDCVIESGMRFFLDGDEYLLCRCGTDEYCLNDLNDGNLWVESGTLEEMAKQLNEAEAKFNCNG